MSRALLHCGQICRSFSRVTVLHPVEWRLNAGEVLGLVGENGAGKSTLMNIVAGVLSPDAGQMELEAHPYAPRDAADARRQGIFLIHQELNLFANLSIADNFWLTLPAASWKRGSRRRRWQQVVAALDRVGLSCSPRTLVESLAPGERQLVEIARAVASSPRLLILDEPTSSLSQHEAARVLDLVRDLRQQGTGIIYISHNLDEVMQLCDRVLVMRDGSLVADEPIAAVSTERLIQQMVGRRLDQIFPRRTLPPSDTVLLDAAQLSQPGTIEKVDFRVHHGEIVGVYGLVGAGRTELARILFGLDPCQHGHLQLAGAPLMHRSTRARMRRGLALLSEERRRQGLLLDRDAIANASLAVLDDFSRQGWVRQSDLHQAALEFLKRVGVRASAWEQPVRTLSGGNQQKVLLARWLLRSPQLLILDEPTRGIDIGARSELYRLILAEAERGLGVLWISSELEELLGVCDRLLVMANGEIRAEWRRGDFDRERILAAALHRSAPVAEGERL